MRLIYLDKYETMDDNMSDSQVGARKGKSVRNHFWIMNGVICDVLQWTCKYSTISNVLTACDWRNA